MSHKNARRLKKKLERKYNCEIGIVHKPSWENYWKNYDILEIKPDAIIARRKRDGAITVMQPIAPWEIDNIRNLLS